ncbi:hypothetical protein, partial [Brooklawnia cerclae]
PAWLQSLAAFLPTDAALSTFRNAVAGQVTETFVSMVPLVFWTFVAFAATAYLTERARVVPVREFRTEPGEPVLRLHPRSA